MVKCFLCTVCLIGLVAGPDASARDNVVIYDEADVPEYTLPDPLVCRDGTKVVDSAIWFQKRRPEILSLFETTMFGIAPGRPEPVKYEVTCDPNALDGKAVRKQIAICLSEANKQLKLEMLLYLPKTAGGPAPVFLGLNFGGNHIIHPDPKIRLPASLLRPDKEGRPIDKKELESERGVSSGAWPVELILSHGYGVATIYYGDIDPDFHDGFKNGVHALYPPADPADRKPDQWASIAAWAWGLSRAMDYFETDTDIDSRRVAVIGHSRLGKTALWAGATDQRFALVVSNNSGCGGAALSRRRYGESVEKINTSFPHWFCENFKKYNNNEKDQPVDQHMLIALIAPRPVYIASAVEDRWADPHGEFLSAVHADPVYRLLGTDGIPVQQMPEPDAPVSGTIGYHLRTGKHNLTEYDWEQYLKFADKHLMPFRVISHYTFPFLK